MVNSRRRDPKAPRYAQVPHALLTAGASPGAIKTYAVIRMKAWDYGSQYLSGVEALADEVGVSRQAVSKHLGELESLGAIKREKRPRGRAIPPILVTHPSSYVHSPDVVSRKGEATTARAPVVTQQNRDVDPGVRQPVNLALRPPSSERYVSKEEDSFNRHQEEPSSRFLEEEESREWWLSEGTLVVPQHLEDTPDAVKLLRIASMALEGDRADLFPTLQRLQDLAPRLVDVAQQLSDWWWSDDVGF